jgi:hypothetical protein
MKKGRVGEERRGKETDRCPLTPTRPFSLRIYKGNERMGIRKSRKGE